MVNINFEIPIEIHTKAKSKAALKKMKLQDYIIQVVKEANEADDGMGEEGKI